MELGDNYGDKDSYNNAVEILVTKCKNETGLEIDGLEVIAIRSVGNENVKYTSEGIIGNDTIDCYTSDYMQSNVSSYGKPENGGDWFTMFGYNDCNLKQADNNYKNDFDKMNELGIISSDTIYWLASRYAKVKANGCYLYLRTVSDNVIDEGGNLISVRTRKSRWTTSNLWS